MKGKGYNLFFLICLLFLFLSVVPVPVSAQICGGPPLVPCGRGGTPDCEFCHLFVLFNNIMDLIFTCLVPIASTFFMVIGGIYLLTAGESRERYDRARSIIKSVVFGLAIIFMAWMFVDAFLTSVGIAGWTGTWWQINCP
jgi:hypothetical protein